jgi:cyclopropane fatty-acyl-phospholipid synthase-like methyltransferase
MSDKQELRSERTKQYWERNIEGFSGFYDTGSEEGLAGPRVIRALYRRFIFPVEKKFMRKRYLMVRSFIDREVKPGQRATDIGCGSGIFSILMAENGADVLALDFADAAVALTTRNIPEHLRGKIAVRRHDISADPIPNTDVAIAIGVLPYIQDEQEFMGNMLEHSQVAMFNFLDADNPINIIRKFAKMIDPRGYYYHTRSSIDQRLQGLGFTQREFEPLATGFAVYARR